MRSFDRQSTKGGRFAALNHYFKPTISDKVFNSVAEELNVNGNVCEISERYFEYTNEQRKIMEDEYDLQFKDYRDNDEEARTKHINKEIKKIAIP